MFLPKYENEKLFENVYIHVKYTNLIIFTWVEKIRWLFSENLWWFLLFTRTTGPVFLKKEETLVTT